MNEALNKDHSNNTSFPRCIEAEDSVPHEVFLKYSHLRSAFRQKM